MIYFFFGENSYARDTALARLIGEQTPELFDGETLDFADLPEIFTGQSLFLSTRLIVIKQASVKADIWAKIDDFLERIDDDTTLIFIETKPDKRTKTYKTLKKLATAEEFLPLKNIGEATRFLQQQATQRQLDLSTTLARHVAERVGTDSQQLMRALEKIELLETVDRQAIDEVVDASSETQIFGLFEAALGKRSADVHTHIEQLRRTHNPHQAIAFLANQTMQFAAIAVAPADASVASDLKVHPFVVQKLTPFARSMSRNELHAVVDAVAVCDVQLKSSGAESWGLIEDALQKIAVR